MFKDLWDFEGSWQLERAIAHQAGQRATLSGNAVFFQKGQGLLYEESGLLFLEGQSPVRAERRYLWTQLSNGQIEVSFEDGSFFHKIDLADPHARHNCAPDVYNVQYEFGDWPNWKSQWHVQGPKKDYNMMSYYTRMSLE